MLAQIWPNFECWLGSFVIFHWIAKKSKKGDKDQESMQSSTTPDPGYHMGK